MDSLDIVEFVLEVERTFDVELPEEATQRLHDGTFGELWRLVVRLRTGVEPPPGAPPTADPTWRRLVALAAALSGVPADDVCWDAPLLRRRSPGRGA